MVDKTKTEYFISPDRKRVIAIHDWGTEVFTRMDGLIPVPPAAEREVEPVGGGLPKKKKYAKRKPKVKKERKLKKNRGGRPKKQKPEPGNDGEDDEPEAPPARERRTYTPGQRLCKKCGQPGHNARTCGQPRIPASEAFQPRYGSEDDPLAAEADMTDDKLGEQIRDLKAQGRSSMDIAVELHIPLKEIMKHWNG